MYLLHSWLQSSIALLCNVLITVDIFAGLKTVPSCGHCANNADQLDTVLCD